MRRESFKRDAIVAVLSKLGSEGLTSLKLHLRKEYYIDLDKEGLFTLEELQIALQRYLGPDGASLLIREIEREMRNMIENDA